MTEPAEPSTDAATAPEDPPQPQPDADEPESPNHEAAKYRVQVRELQAQLAQRDEVITGYRRREAEAAIADLLDEPADIWDIGQADVAEFYTEDGQLDEGVLRASAGALCEMRPKLAKPRGPTHQNFGQYSPPPPAPSAATWDAVLKP